MLTQTSVAEVKNGKIPRKGSHIVITMRFYPRFLRKELREEFVCDLAPKKELLSSFNAAQKKLNNHNDAFAEVDYENTFYLTPEGWEHLRRLSEMSHEKDVYLVCICAAGERCHREMLMLLGKELFGAPIGKLFHSYPDLEKRIPEFRQASKAAGGVKKGRGSSA